jgi:hypothetical protein
VSTADGRAKRKASTAARLGRPFTLRVGRQIALQGQELRLRFAEVTQDSRCPVDVTCVWAGNAAVRLWMSNGNGRGGKTLTLNTNKSPSLNDEAQYQGFKIKLVGLSPYPRSDHSIAAGDYTATLLVSK